MNELFDHLLMKISFTIIICGLIFIYKYLHAFLYPSSRRQLFKKFYPSVNTADSLHFFSRILGIGIVFSSLQVQFDQNLLSATLDFILQGILSLSIYLTSIYILESITLFNFEYVDEIVKRKNLAYALISFSQSIVLAFLIKNIFVETHHAFIDVIYLWLLGIVLLGLTSRLFKVLSKLTFNQLLLQKNLGLAYSYSGLLFGTTVIINTAIQQNIKLHPRGIDNYFILGIQIISTILLAFILFPILKKGLILAFNLHEDLEIQEESTTGIAVNAEAPASSIGHGIFEGTIFFTSSYLTATIIKQLI